MKKYFINFHIRTNECSFAFVNNYNDNYLNVKLAAQNQISYSHPSDLLTWHEQVLTQVKEVVKKDNVTLNYVFDDNLFPNLEQKIMVNKLNCQNTSYDSKILSELFTQKNDTLIKAHVIEDFLNDFPINYTMQKNEIIKEYKDIPKNRIAETITQYLSVFKTNLPLSSLNDFKAIFSANILNCKTNYFLQSQILAASMKNIPTSSLVVDLQADYITFFVVKNGAILTYKKMPFGYNMLDNDNEFNNLQIIKYQVKNQFINENDLEEEPSLVPTLNGISKQYSAFKNSLLNELLKYTMISFKNPLITQLSHIAFTGQLAWMVKDIEEMFFSRFNEHNMTIQSLNNDNNFRLFTLDDSILEQVVLVTNENKAETIQNNTVLSKIDYTHPKAKTNLLSKLFSRFNLR
ncbi:MAG3720 family protein [Mycoplasma sp. 005V]|uniref:MAG3720 family protein n=1 Tax=unclassified Mycoplasma TaxID=2683645 RepID=UPI003A873D83